MHCKQCDYPLWNLAARQCPECGVPFKPSDYEFVPDSVKFLCPHCKQEYYGRSDKGHLDPPEFDCITCKARLKMDEMVLQPGKDLTEKQTWPGVMPWFERQHRGRFKAFFQTIGMAMVMPAKLIRGVPVESSVGAALVYAMQTTLVLFAIGGLIPGVLWLLAYYGVGGMWGGMGGMGSFMFLFILVPYWLILPFALLGLILIWPMTAHLTLRWTGGCKHPIDRTFHAFAYSAGANALSAVPCVGPLLGWVWWVISAGIMLAFGQKVHGLRAALAVAILPLLLVVTGGGLFGLGVWAQQRMMGAMMVGAVSGGGLSANTQSTLSLNQMLISNSWQSNGTAPTHIIEHMIVGQMAYYFTITPAGGAMTAQSRLRSENSKTADADIPVGELTLDVFLAASSTQKLKSAAQLLESLPADMTAYRFGDYIFTYPGAALNSMDPQLWTMVMLPDPDVNGLPAAKDTIHIATADYNVQEVTFDQLPALLQAQNQYRATLGLPPLPDLTTITHAKPATRSQTDAGADSEQQDDD